MNTIFFCLSFAGMFWAFSVGENGWLLFPFVIGTGIEMWHQEKSLRDQARALK